MPKWTTNMQTYQLNAIDYNYAKACDWEQLYAMIFKTMMQMLKDYSKLLRYASNLLNIPDKS